LPPYTTDTYDHDREAAENDLNEKMEAEKLERLPSPLSSSPSSSSTYISYSSNADMRSSTSSSSSLSFDDEHDSGSEDLDVFDPSYPSRPCWLDLNLGLRHPRTLLDLIQRLSSRH
jgi:hypothetical protein